MPSAAARGAARASAEAMAAAGPWAERKDCVSAAGFVQACAQGGDLIVMRAPIRTAAFFAEELRSAARLVSLPSPLLRSLGGGVWHLLPAAAAAEDAAAAAAEDASSIDTDTVAAGTMVKEANAAAARTRLYCLLSSLAGVRMCMSLIAAAADSRALLSKLRSQPPVRHAPQWSLHYEQHYPAADHIQLPFSPVSVAPALAIRLHALVGDGFVDDLGSDLRDIDRASAVSHRQRSECDAFVLLELKHVLLFCRRQQPSSAAAQRERTACGAPQTAQAEPVASMRAATPSTGAATEEDATSCTASATMATQGALRAVPWWVPLWERRPFDFSACLDPFVATAAVNIAASAHLRLHKRTSVPPVPLRVFDPCCGSGTILAAAAALGHTALGADLRAEFVSRVPSNLELLGLQVAQLAVQDATGPFLPLLLSDEQRPDVVVCNPPWGKNFGLDDDGARIVLSVIRQCSGATMLFLVNATALEAAIQLSGVTLLHHARLGGVEAMLLRTDRVP
mmetsp:Transcript_19272/g.44302  ORF Transcript_19272/g.44302 Transcript_19272/m.44302 type:complete len:509 (-) Transcript_19272:68-1594(-)